VCTVQFPLPLNMRNQCIVAVAHLSDSRHASEVSEVGFSSFLERFDLVVEERRSCCLED
jgi:hypothetical protein